MSISTGAQGSWRRALRARPFSLVALLGLLAVGLAGTWAGPRPEQMVLAGYGSSGPAPASAERSSPAGQRASTSGSFTIAGRVAGLYPGVTKHLVLRVTNPQGFAIVVTAIETKGQNASARCTASYLAVTSFSGHLSVPARGSAKTSVLAKLARRAPNACIGATFPLVYRGLGRKA
jgi:hypothetical protein